MFIGSVIARLSNGTVYSVYEIICTLKHWYNSFIFASSALELVCAFKSLKALDQTGVAVTIYNL